MLSIHAQTAEPLPQYIARKTQKFLHPHLPSVKRTIYEAGRTTRSTANSTAPFFRLPTELRNAIYLQLLPRNREVKRSRHPRAQPRLPALLQVCQQMRAETYPIFFAANSVFMTLQHLTQHPRSPLLMRSTLNLLPDKPGTDLWRSVRIECSSRCFHADGFAVLSNIDIFIDRAAQTIRCQPRAAAHYLRPCCQRAQKEFGAKLLKELQAREFHIGRKRLRKEDFVRLAKRMDESRGDWPKSGKRVIPQRFVRL
ncbi:hypothetical protein BDY17DRAFT_291280 [Neohortaea acidophila]|uniref:2EXR domain-containing protein n=1 Tax=Neohortaea acidophila TaxID=245834 RepID=A0A6A6Q227_9PEZI|nr:uncharacterized protein BDY17DRAFT_291280 [Neohortaea acidophila]KAF2486332.1 hypothetical protein BDY17DRAFT_291280 [Neohortaea acidophila]